MSKNEDVIKDVVIKFDNEIAAKHFITWLCESGEQDYWMWMQEQECMTQGEISATQFEYCGPTGGRKQFGKHPIIAKCGRLTK